MRTVATRDMKSLWAGLAVSAAALGLGNDAMAQGKPVAAAPPASAAAGALDTETACAKKPQLCEALHTANKALLEAAAANQKGKYVCTSRHRPPRCGSPSPKTYLLPLSPYGNPADVAEGRELLDWYLRNLTCEALCKPKQDPLACQRACDAGTDPKDFPDSGVPTGKPGKTPKR